MELTVSVLMFLAQLLCCVLVKHKIWRYTPTLIAAFFLSATVLNANLMDTLDPERLVSQTRVVLFCCFAVALYHAIMIIWKRMKDSDSAQKL